SFPTRRSSDLASLLHGRAAGAAGRARGAPARRSRCLLGAAHLPRRRAAASRLVLLATGDGRSDVLLDLGGGAVREPRRQGGARAELGEPDVSGGSAPERRGGRLDGRRRARAALAHEGPAPLPRRPTPAAR